MEVGHTLKQACPPRRAAWVLHLLVGLLGFGAVQVGANVSYEGVVIHGVPHLFEADGTTLKNSSKKKIRLITNRGESGAVGDAMGRVVPVLGMAVQEINSRDDILPDYVVELHLTDSRCANQFAVQSSLRLIYNNPAGFFHMQFGPLCSGPTGAVNDMVQVFKMFQLATISRSASLSDGSRYPFLCRTSPSLQFVADGISKLVQVFGWTRVAAVQDTKGLSASTVTEFKAAATKALDETGYPFDIEYLFANHYVIDDKNYYSDDVVRMLKEKLVKISLVALYEDAGIKFYCSMFRQGYYGKDVQTILALSWWGDSWITEQVAEQSASLPCSADDVYVAAKGMFSMGQTAFLDSTARHEITGTVLNDIKANYFSACTASTAEGCHTDFASYDYDGLTLVAKAFHTWIYDQGHSLDEITYRNDAPQRELYEIVKGMRFLGCTGEVAFFDEVALDCERKGTFSIRQLRYLAQNKGDTGWTGIASFTNADGFATITPWASIHWQDSTETYFGSGHGWRSVSQGQAASFGDDNIGLNNLPKDWIQCPAGQASNGTHCVTCPPGQEERNGECTACQPGEFSELSERLGYLRCIQCPSGKFQHEAGKSSCIDCEVGSVSNPFDPATCQKCSAGRYIHISGQAECFRCSSGKYQAKEGQSECVPCPEMRTTEYLGATMETECVCRQDFYEPEVTDGNASFECLPCPEGMTCGVGCRLADWTHRDNPNRSTEEALVFPELKHGYYSNARVPLTVYKCIDEDNCPGGPPGSCAAQRRSDVIACGKCMDGYYEDNAKLCNECSGHGSTVFIILGTLAAFTFLGLLVVVINKNLAMQGHATLLIAITAGQTCTTVQAVGTFSQLSITWVEPLKSAFGAMALLSFDLKVLQVECSVGTDALLKYFLRQCIGPFSLIIIGFMLIIKKYVRDRTVDVCVEYANTAGALLKIVFMSVVLSCLLPLICYGHPTGHSYSMVSSPSTLCYIDPTHVGMMIVGVCAFMIVVVPYVTLVGYATWKYPAALKNASRESERKLRMWRFIFFQYNVNCHSYAVAQLLRAIGICIVPVVIRDNAPVQLLLTSGVILIFLALQLYSKPWRVALANVADGALSTTLVMILICVSLSTNIDPSTSHAVGIMATIIFVFLCTTILAGFAFGLYMRFMPKKAFHSFISHHKADASAQARFIQLCITSRTNRPVFIDSDHLTNLDNLFEAVRSNIERLVCLLTANMLRRPWCAGEIVITHQSHRKAFVVRTASFVDPTEEQLADLDSYLDAGETGLGALGISTHHIAESYKWLLNDPRVPQEHIHGNKLMGRLAFEFVVSRILGMPDRKTSAGGSTTVAPGPGMVCVFSDASDDEATAAAAILIKKSQARLVSASVSALLLADTPDLSEEELLAAAIDALAFVALLTGHSLESPPQMRALTLAVQIMEVAARKGEDIPLIPVNTPSFQFPSDAAIQRVFARTFPRDCEAACLNMKKLFKRISVYFATNASDEVITTQAAQVLGRLGIDAMKKKPNRRTNREMERVKMYAIDTAVQLTRTSSTLDKSGNALEDAGEATDAVIVDDNMKIVWTPDGPRVIAIL